MMITRHYFKRNLIDPIAIGIYIFFPLILVSLLVATNNYVVQGYDHLIYGRNVSHSFNLIVNLLIFQLMGSLIVIDFLYEDLRGDMRWRLLSSPTPMIRFALGNFTASLAFSVLSGGFLLLAGAFVFNAYMHNIWMMVAVLVLVAAISQLVGVLFFLLCNKKATANTLGTVFCWGNVLLSGFMFGIGFGERLTEFGRLYTPFGWAVRAIMFSGALADGRFPGIIEKGGMADAFINLGYLAGFCAALTLVIFLLARRKPL
jgi:hypothetical protein